MKLHAGIVPFAFLALTLVGGSITPFAYANPIFQFDVPDLSGFSDEQKISDFTAVPSDDFGASVSAFPPYSDLDIEVVDDIVFIGYYDTFGFFSYYHRTDSSIIDFNGNLNPYLFDVGFPGPFDTFDDTSFELHLSDEFNDAFRDPGFELCGLGIGGPQIEASESTIFVAWPENPGDCSGSLDDAHMSIISSTDGGFDFSPKVSIPLTDSFAFGGDPIDIEMVAIGDVAYLVWNEQILSTINFSKFNATTSSFDPVTELSIDSAPVSPSIAVDGSNVVAVWQEFDSSIKYAHSANSGADFTTFGEIDTSSVTPKIAVSNGNFYVVYTEGEAFDSEILLSRSTDGGATFGTPIQVSSNTGLSFIPQIDASGNSVFVVWQDTIDENAESEILFSKSTDGGLTFSTPINLSKSTGVSDLPQMSVSGNDIHVVWRDYSFADIGFSEVWERSSNDSGDSFGGLQIISETPIDIANPVPFVDSSSDVAAVFYLGDEFDSLGEAGFKHGVNSDVSLTFDKTQYSAFDDAMISLIDPNNFDTTAEVEVNGIPVDLNGPGDGTFAGSIDLDLDFGATEGVGDLFQASYDSGNGIISTFAKTLESRSFVSTTSGGPNTSFDLGSFVGFEVEDASANLNSLAIDYIVVTATSETNPNGVSITLFETSPNSGKFVGENNLVFMNGEFTPQLLDSYTIVQVDKTAPDNATKQTVEREISTTTDGPKQITLTETGLSTDTYTAEVIVCPENYDLCSTRAGYSGQYYSIKANEGDFVTLKSLSGDPVTNGIVLPDNSPIRAALEVLITEAIVSEDVVFEYNGLVINGDVGDLLSGGGGGGGISRAGFVINALVGAKALFGGSGGGSQPVAMTLESVITSSQISVPDEIEEYVLNYESGDIVEPWNATQYENFDFPLEIDEMGYPLASFETIIQTHELETDKPVKIQTTFYQSLELEYYSFYTDMGDYDTLEDSGLYFTYEKDQPFVTSDPNGLLESVSHELQVDGIKKTMTLNLVFGKGMDVSQIMLRIWDVERRSWDTHILSAISVTDTNPEIPSTGEFVTENSNSTEPLAGEYYYQKFHEQAILDWFGGGLTEKSDSELLAEFGLEGKIIPGWYKPVVEKWFTTYDISIDDVENSLIYFEQNGLTG